MINNTVLVGRLTRDPELRKTTNGKSVVSFTVAVNRRFSSQGQEQADFINCVAWERQADFMANYLKKGALVGIEGRIQSRSYEDPNTGKRVYVQEVVVENLQALESRAQREGGASTPSYDYAQDTEPSKSYDDGPVLDITSDDLPF